MDEKIAGVYRAMKEAELRGEDITSYREEILSCRRGSTASNRGTEGSATPVLQISISCGILISYAD